MNFCTKCGNQINPDARFCGNCGSPIDEREQNIIVDPVKNTVANKVSPVFTASSQDFSMPNTQQRIVNQWYFITFVFLVGISIPFWIGMDGMQGGFGLSFLFGFMVMVGLIVILIYHGRAKQMDKILSGEGRIAVWHYTPDEWMRFVAADFEDEKRTRKNLFIMVVVISLIVGMLLMVVIQDALILLVIAGIILIVAIPAFWVPRFRFRKLQHSEATALIAENGVIVGKMFHLWIKLGASLDKVSINSEADPAIIEFAYSMPTRTGIQEEVARVPIPKGKINEAIRIMECFNANILKNTN